MNAARALLLPAAILCMGSLALRPVQAQPSTNRAPGRLPLPPGVKVLKNLEYGHGSGRPMLLDLYLYP
jgi:hypothetical protein